MSGNKITTSYTPVNDEDLTRKGYVDTQDALKANLTGGNTFSGNQVFNSGTISISSRLLGEPDASPSGNFWIGLRGTGTEVQRLAIGITGAETTGIVNIVSIPKTLELSGLTASRVLQLDASKNVQTSAVTITELGYVSGVTSSIQTQINNVVGTFASYLPLSGGAITGNLSVAGTSILTGNVGIGTTTPGTYKLYVNGTSALAGQVDSGVNGNTVPNIKFANSESHIDNSASEVYLFTAFAGHMGIQRNTTRNATTACLVLGTSGTEESEIISTKANNTGLMPLAFAASTYHFATGGVGIGLPSSGVFVAPLARFTINANYSGGQDGGFCINANDGNVYNLRLFPYVQASSQVGYQFRVNNNASSVDSLALGYNGYVGIGTNNPSAPLTVNGSITIKPANGVYEAGCIFSNTDWGMLFRGAVTPAIAHFRWDSAAGAELMRINTNGNVGIGTNPGSILDVFSSAGSYNTSLRVRTAWAGIELASSGSGGRTYNLTSTITGAGIGAGGFGIYDETAGAYRLSINSSGTVKCHGDLTFDTLPNQTNTTYNNTSTHLMFRSSSNVLVSGTSSTWSYYNSSVSWVFGLTVNNAFYVPNTTCSILITFVASQYSSFVQTQYAEIIIQPNGAVVGFPPLFSVQAYKFYNLTSNHEQITHTFVIPNNHWGASTIGWKQVYFQGSGLSDANDTVAYSVMIIG
jgi:hypothetical protein